MITAQVHPPAYIIAADMEESYPMRILITGATGVIGRRAVPLILAEGHQVTAIGRSENGRAALEREGASTISLDLFDRSALRKAIAGHDVVVNLATHIPAGYAALWPGAWRETGRIRSVGSAMLAEEARAAGVRRFVQESFVTYPDSGDRWITEQVPTQPAHYNRAVLDAEASAERFGSSGGEWVVLRFAYFYGAGDGFTENMLGSVRRGWLPVPGRPGAYMPMLSHRDAARAVVVAALEAPSGVYNAADDEPLTHRAIGDTAAGLLHVSPPKLPPSWVTLLGGSVAKMVGRSLRVSNAKLRQATKWAPRDHSVREGLARIVGGGNLSAA